jgi:DNA-binding MarR family transcriptional regulator
VTSPGGGALGADNVLFQFFRTQQSLRELMAQVVEGSGITSFDYALLGVVSLLGPLSPSELAARTAVPPTTVSRYVAGFVDRGLVSRAPNPADGRSYLVEITPAGRAAVERVLPRLRRAVQALAEQAGTPLAGIVDVLVELDERARRVLQADLFTANR